MGMNDVGTGSSDAQKLTKVKVKNRKIKLPYVSKKSRVMKKSKSAYVGDFQPPTLSPE
jgi:hypothetical protein